MGPSGGSKKDRDTRRNCIAYTFIKVYALSIKYASGWPVSCNHSTRINYTDASPFKLGVIQSSVKHIM